MLLRRPWQPSVACPEPGLGSIWVFGRAECVKFSIQHQVYSLQPKILVSTRKTTMVIYGVRYVERYADDKLEAKLQPKPKETMQVYIETIVT